LLPFFPIPQPDEILIHIAARYQDLRSLPSLHSPIEHFFGTPAPKLSYEFPVGLDRLSTVIPGSHFTPEYFIAKHTMLPLYKPFLPISRSDKIIKFMCGRPISSTNTIANALSCRIKRPTHYRYCPIHAAEEIKVLGYPYFHRLHQVPGVVVCPIHRCNLETSNVATSSGRHLYSANGHTQIQNMTIISEKAVSNDFVIFAQDAEWLLNNGMDTLSIDNLQQRYIDLLIERGLASNTGHVSSNRLVDAFLERFDDKFIDNFDSRIDPQNRRSWLARIVQTNEVQHPIRHLLLLRFLDISAEEILGQRREIFYFGSGPWQCKNKICPCFNQSVINQYQQGFTRHTKCRPMGLFRCPHCAFSYSLTTPLSHSINHRPSMKVLEYGYLWDERLKELWFDRTFMLKTICTELGVGIDTIHRQAKRLGLPKDRVKSNNDSTIVKNKLDIEAARATWLNLLDQHRTKSLTEMRIIAPNTYNVLLRFDVEWLRQHKPLRKLNPKKRVDWKQRDTWLCENVRAIVERIKSEAGKPIQVTFNAIAKAIGWGEGSIQRDKQKLPAAFALIETLVESHEDFAVRRIHYILEQSRQNRKQLTRSELIKLAGLNPPVKTERVMRELDLAFQNFLNVAIFPGDT